MDFGRPVSGSLMVTSRPVAEVSCRMQSISPDAFRLATKERKSEVFSPRRSCRPFKSIWRRSKFSPLAGHCCMFMVIGSFLNFLVIREESVEILVHAPARIGRQVPDACGVGRNFSPV